jgi:hypothetical protein
MVFQCLLPYLLDPASFSCHEPETNPNHITDYIYLRYILILYYLSMSAVFSDLDFLTSNYFALFFISPARAMWLPHLILRNFIPPVKYQVCNSWSSSMCKHFILLLLPVTSGEVFPFTLVDLNVILSCFPESKPNYSPGLIGNLLPRLFKFT